MSPPSNELVKLYYRIGEVSRIVGVQPHVLRYWETEFRTIRPQKSSKGQRIYSRRDVEKLLSVKDLLKNQGFTIAGARRRLREGPSASQLSVVPATLESGSPQQSATEGAKPSAESPASAETIGLTSAPPGILGEGSAPVRPVGAAIIPRPISHRPTSSSGSAKAVRSALLALRQDLLDLEHDLEADLPGSTALSGTAKKSGSTPARGSEASGTLEVPRKPRDDGRPDASRGTER